MLFDVNGFLDECAASSGREAAAHNLFESHRKKWGGRGSVSDARCDFAPNKASLWFRNVAFHALWKKSIYGATLNEIKSDPDRPKFFADNMAEFIAKVIGCNLDCGDWTIATPPPRRHTERNFAQSTAILIAEQLRIQPSLNVAKIRSKGRINAIFDPVDIPRQANIIVFDDIVTTGSTLTAMRNLLLQYHKNVTFFAAINNA